MPDVPPGDPERTLPPEPGYDGALSQQASQRVEPVPGASVVVAGSPVASIPSTMAWQLCVIATGYAALTLSGSATELGIVTSLGGLPMLVLAPIGGGVADRLPRRTVLFFSQTA